MKKVRTRKQLHKLREELRAQRAEDDKPVRVRLSKAAHEQGRAMEKMLKGIDPERFERLACMDCAYNPGLCDTHDDWGTP